jgi:protein ImuB
MSRIACILVSDFSISALIRANPALEGRMLALVESPAPHAELIAVSPRARGIGIRVRMTIAQAHAIASELVTAIRSPAAERSATDALVDVAESISPVVEAGESGCVWLDLAGMERIYSSEDEAAADIVGRVRRVGMEAAIGIAANLEIALLAARCGGMRIIEPGLEREFLNWLPLDVLDLDAANHNDDLQMSLERLGLKRLGDLARLDSSAVGTRFGRRGVELARLVRGGNSRPLTPRRHAETFAEMVDLDYRIENLGALGFVMRAMLERIVERLRMRGLIGGDIGLAFGLEGHRIDHRRIAIAAASNDARAMLALINLKLAAEPPDDAIESIRIEVEPRRPRFAQASLFAPPAPAPDKLQLTIARLSAMCGPDNVGMLKPENSHRPEAVRLEAFQSSPRPSSAGESAAAKDITQLVIRAIRPAMEVEVMCTRGMPEYVRGSNLGGRVVSIAGPWRRDGEWWRQPDGGFARDYYEFALDDGGVYRAFCDLNSQRWFVDGVYD